MDMIWTCQGFSNRGSLMSFHSDWTNCPVVFFFKQKQYGQLITVITTEAGVVTFDRGHTTVTACLLATGKQHTVTVLFTLRPGATSGQSLFENHYVKQLFVFIWFSVGQVCGCVCLGIVTK